MPKRHILHCGALLLAAALAGCSASENLTPVSGKVLSGSEPLSTGSITFHPESPSTDGNPLVPRAELAADGTYSLFTNASPGAPPGSYKVTISAEAPRDAEASGADAYAPAQYLVKDQYMSPDKTPLTVEVKADAAAGSYDFTLDPK